MDYLGNSILELKSTDPSILADIILLREAVSALEGAQQFGSVSCVADSGETQASQPVTQSTFLVARDTNAFFRRGYAQPGFAVNTNQSEGLNLYALEENNVITGLRWERRETEPTSVKFLITARTDFTLSRVSNLTMALQILSRDVNGSSFNFTPRYGNLIRYPVDNGPEDTEVSHRVLWTETVDLAADPRIHFIDFKIIGQGDQAPGVSAFFDYKTGGYAATYENFITVKRIQ